MNETMNKADAATQSLNDALAKHKDRAANTVNDLVVKTMNTLAANINIANANTELVQMRLEEFEYEGDIVYMEFCKIIRQKLGENVSILWRGGVGNNPDYVSISLYLNSFTQ